MGNDRPLDIRWTLAHDDDLISVLRGHLLIETRLGELLAKRFPQSGEVLEELGFAEKCRLDRRQGIIDRDLTRALTALGHLRDSFAHLPVKAELTDEDETEFLNAFSLDSRMQIEEWSKGAAKLDQRAHSDSLRHCDDCAKAT